MFKKYSKFMFVFALVLGALFLASCSGANPAIDTPLPSADAPQLPELLVSVLTMVVGGGVVFLVTAGFKGLCKALGWSMDGPVGTFAKVAAATIAGAVVSTLIGLTNFALSMFPPELWPTVAGVLSLIVTVLTAMGYQYQAKAKLPTPPVQYLNTKATKK